MSPLERIVSACGGELFDGGRRALIPGPGHSAQDRSVSLLQGEDGHVLIYCFSPKDDWREVRRQLEERGLLGANAKTGAASDDWTSSSPSSLASRPGERLERAKRFWAEARPIRATAAVRYLTQRALPETLIHAAPLRFHPAMTSLEDRVRRPALLSAICDVHGDLQGVEITLLSPYGVGKAALAKPRRVVGKLMGGAVRLANAASELLIAEGMETTASASIALQLPGWALLSARNLSLFTPPARVKRLVVASDNDATADIAFARLVRRVPSSIQVERASPPPEFNDWNDWAQTNAKR